VKNYSLLTVKTYKTPILKAIEISEIYEEENSTYIIFDITKYRIQIAKQNNKTINKKISSIKSFLTFLDTKNISIKLLGATSVKSPQTLPKPILTSNIFESIESSTLEEKVIVLFIYSFGIRISELESLKIENIHDEYILVTGKSNKQRQIPSNDVINILIKQYINDNNPSMIKRMNLKL
jgi:integrase/recombinase XerD